MRYNYTIRYNAETAQGLADYFNVEHMWNIRTPEAIRFSVNGPKFCDTEINSDSANLLSMSEFLKIFLSGLPITSSYGNLIGFGREYIRNLEEKKDISALVGLTNYIFKHLSLSETEFDALTTERILRASQDLHYWANISIHNIRSVDESYYSLPSSIDKTFEHVEISGRDVVFVFMTRNYLGNFAHWLDLYVRHDSTGKHVLVLSIGDDFADSLREMLKARHMYEAQIVEFQPPFLLDVCGNGMELNFLWFIKVYVTKLLLYRGLRVTYSDLDAYWIKNYFITREKVIEQTSADIIVSMTFDMPKSTVVTRGFTACVGFFSADPTSGGIAALEDWCTMTEIMFDDQIAFAELLLRNGSAWDLEDSTYVAASTNFLTSKGSPVKISILNSDTARRVGLPDPSTIGSTTIWHPRWVMAADQHEKAIRAIEATSAMNSSPPTNGASP